MTDSEQQSIFKLWLDAHKGLLFKIVRAYAPIEEDRDDLFQEISIQIWRSVPKFRQESAVTTWLYRIALNTALRWKSKEGRKVAIDHDLDHQKVLKQSDVDPQSERVDWLYSEIAKLNDIDRSLCLLLLDDFSYKEMADIVGITESNVAIKIHRIKKHLTEQSKNKLHHEI